MKRLFDIIASGCGLIVLSPLYVILAVWVKLDSEGLDNVFSHWMYLIGAFLLLAVAYVLFKKKYYHLHEEYLASLMK